MTPQSLNTVSPGRVIHYREIKSTGSIALSVIDGKFLWLYRRCPPCLNVNFDLFFNSNSFQETEYDVIDNYLYYIRDYSGSVFLNTLTGGQQRGEAGQVEPITYRWLRDKIVSKGYSKQELLGERECRGSAFRSALPKNSVGFFKGPI